MGHGFCVNGIMYGIPEREEGVYPVIIIDYVFGLEPTEVQRAAERKEIIKLHTQKMS